MVQIAKIGHAAFQTTNLEGMLSYYTDVLGLALTERGEDESAYLTTGADHHDVSIHPGAENRLDHVAFQLESGLSLQEAADELRGEKIEVEEKADSEPGIEEMLQIQDPEGNAIQLYANVEPADGVSAQPGVSPRKLGHVAILVNDPKRITDFYQDVLGFRWSDWLEDFFVFLRCNADHHSMNFLQSPEGGRMHHIGFELNDWAHVKTACDHLAKNDHRLVWGPGRHGPGHNVFTYHPDPDGNKVELFTELDLMLDENLGHFDPRPWHEDNPQKPKVWQATPVAPNDWGILPPEGFMG